MSICENKDEINLSENECLASNENKINESLTKGKQKKKTRQKHVTWDHKVEFVLSILGYAIGVGNLWRFPYLCMLKGGGAFILAYVFSLFTVGMPLFLMELVIGQYSGLSVLFAFNLAPFFKGLGWSMVGISGFLCVYYNIIMAWTLFYFGISFKWDVPWRSCNNTWNTPSCVSLYDISLLNKTYAVNGTPRSSADEFWHKRVLQISDGIEDVGQLNWQLTICLASAWIIVFLCLIKGIRSSGKVAYVTAIFPYLLLTVLLIRGVTLPGSLLGIKFYLHTDWSMLKNYDVWYIAAQQVFYTLGPAWGGLVTMSSYNKTKNNLIRDAMLVPIMCFATSFYAGFTVFSIVGHTMHISGQTKLNRELLQGPSLAFIAYPEALAQLPATPVWSILFFLTLIFLGLDSQFGMMETVISGIIEFFPNYLSNRKILFTACLCFFEFLLGLPMVTNGGFYIFSILEWYSTSIVAMIIGLIESIAISYFYGIRRLLGDIERMLGPQRKVFKIYFGLMIALIVPSCVTIMLILMTIKFVPLKMENGKDYPIWTQVLGWSIAVFFMLPMPTMAIYESIKHRKCWRNVFKPNEIWNDAIDTRFQIKEDSETYNPR